MSRALKLAAVHLAALTTLAAPASAQGPRTPYLQMSSEDAVTVVWRTAADDAPQVCYGAAPDALNDTASGTMNAAGNGIDQYEVRVTGLAADTRYYYSVGHATCPPASPGDPDQHLTTHPLPGIAAPVRFWVVGDSGTGGSAQRNVFSAMLAEAGSEPPDLFLHVGDMAYSDGTTTEFDDRFYAVYASLLQNTTVWPAIGNHEGHTSTSSTESGPYYEGYVLPRDGVSGGLPSGTEAYYSFDYANVHFIVLDSYGSPRETTGAMVRWLEMDLAATTADWLVAYWHHPAYTDGSHQDNEGAQEDMRTQVLPTLEAGGVDVVFAGHSHIYERSYLLHGGYYNGLPGASATDAIVDMGDGRAGGDGPYQAMGDGALYVVAGHGGTGVRGDASHPLMYFSEVAHGSVLVDVNGQAMTLRNVRVDGSITDDVTLVKADGVFVSAPSGGTFLAGSDIDVVWSSTGTSGQVRIEYSLDDGMSWATVVDSTEDDGAYTWTAPRRMTDLGRVRVTDTSDPALTGQSPRPFTLSAEADVTIIEPGGTWEYHDDGTEPPTDWATDASGGWMSGPAQLGYGDGDEATTLYDADPNVPTVYFRYVVDLAEAPISATATVTFDDGFALFVNGAQVGGVNADDLAHDAYASANSTDNEVTTVDIAGSAFRPGQNVIAAMVKQGGAGSSDLSFELVLDARIRVPLDPPDPDAGVANADAGRIPPGTDGGDPTVDGGPDGGGDDGCGCRVGGRAATPWGALMLVAAVALWRRRR